MAQPTGIIVNTPKIFIAEVGDNYLPMWFDGPMPDRGGMFYWKLSNRPRIDILHCYIVYNGFIRWRCNIAEFLPGQTMYFFSGPCGEREVTGRAWMILTAPVIKAPQEIPMRGFRGFRYTEGFW